MSIHKPNDPKIITFDQACTLIKRAKATGHKVVLAQGVFDVLHIGHTKFLQESKAAGDLLFVGLESDESVKMNKASTRPLNPIEERLQLVAALGCTDFVFGFEDAIPYGTSATPRHKERLKKLQPDALALAVGDNLFQVRQAVLDELGIPTALVRGVWRQYSTTKLLKNLNPGA
jgi:rfaE bifunctional protein nucleotidyltransferase chain/domain